MSKNENYLNSSYRTILVPITDVNNDCFNGRFFIKYIHRYITGFLDGYGDTFQIINLFNNMNYEDFYDKYNSLKAIEESFKNWAVILVPKDNIYTNYTVLFRDIDVFIILDSGPLVKMTSLISKLNPNDKINFRKIQTSNFGFNGVYGDFADIKVGSYSTITCENYSNVRGGERMIFNGKNTCTVNSGLYSDILCGNYCKVNTKSQSTIRCGNGGNIKTCSDTDISIGPNSNLICGKNCTIVSKAICVVKTSDNCKIISDFGNIINCGNRCEITSGSCTHIKCGKNCKISIFGKETYVTADSGTVVTQVYENEYKKNNKVIRTEIFGETVKSETQIKF